ncbi:MAG: pirin family protein [Planctomycetota bacterium]
MISVRRAADRGHADHGWLDTHHTFSFADYHDPRHMGFRSLRVVNEDRVAAGQGFGSHPHRDMEILSYVLSGRLEHRDNLGNGAVIGPGEFQRITAGTGVVHSEFNPSAEEAVHFYQVWIKPRERGATPGYEELRTLSGFDRTAGGATLVASPDGGDGSLTIQQDVCVWLVRLTEEGEPIGQPLAADRGLWVQVTQGEAVVEGETVGVGDGVAIEGVASVSITPGPGAAELLLFDLA